MVDEMKPTTLAFIEWLKHEMETYLPYLDRDTVAIMLWQTRRIWYGIWKASLENGGEAMTTTLEKLIKQVSYRIASIFNERLSRWPTVGERDEIRDKVAGEIVGLVLSAVCDGLSFELIEEIAALEHEQWMEWSKHVADEVSSERRARWEAYWVPYEQLSEEVKEHDRVWARKIIALSGTGKEGDIEV